MIASLSLAELLHWAGAVIYIAIGLLVLIRGPRSSAACWLAFGCGSTSVWASSVALQWPAPAGGLAASLELARSSAWYGFVLRLYCHSAPSQTGRNWIFTVLGVSFLSGLCSLQMLQILLSEPPLLIGMLQTMLHLAIPISVLLLLENLYFNTPVDDRWNLNLICIALAAIFIFDIFLYVDAILFRRSSLLLFEGRIVIFIFAAPLVALAVARNRRWEIKIHVSREVVFHGASLVIAGSLLVALGTAGELVRTREAHWGHVAESAIVVGGMMTVAVLLTSGTFRSRLRTFLAEHFFSYRYDYRREWIRCIDMLTAPQAHVGLYLRAIRTAAAVVDSPAGAIFVRIPGEVTFRWAGSWNCPTILATIPPSDQVVEAFGDGVQIIVLKESNSSLGWLRHVPRAWIAVPLRHSAELIGFVVLGQPRASFNLDREAVDLLRVVGQEIGSRIVEHRAAQILSQTKDLREYSQRFAFVIHDIKNVSGQLSMLLSNAEVHANNPAFQRDMMSTVRAATDRIVKLLARLQAERVERDYAFLLPVERLLTLINGLPIQSRSKVAIRSYCAQAGVALNPESFDTIITHLLNNAFEASHPSGAVYISVRTMMSHLLIDVADQGSGMSAEFVRDDLFRPFASTKAGGHGIGAYQAQELARASGGDLLVSSQIDAGTTMRLLLPSIQEVGEKEASSTEFGGN